MEQISFKIAWRNLWKNKSFTLLNVGGLVTGLSASLLLLLYVAEQWSYNTQFKDAANIYEVKVNHKDNFDHISATTNETPNALAPAMRTELPGIKAIANITWASRVLLVSGDKSVKAENRLAEPDILKILNYEYLSGSAETAFQQPNSIILTESTAKKLFGNVPALNKSIKYMNFAQLTVTGIIKDLPENIGYRFESLVSFNENQGIFPRERQWQNYSIYTLLRLNKGVNTNHFNSNIHHFINKHDDTNKAEPFLYPLLKSHLYDEFENGIPSGGKILQVRIFIGLALGILLIACINFMNLATARAGKRAKEVGIKKTIGASRTSLILQFLVESIIMVIISLIISIAIIEVTLPLFNNLLKTNLSIHTLGIRNWLFVLLAVLLTGIISGSYPAFYLSSFTPINTLKGIVKLNPSSVGLRKVLVVVQFSFAVLVITGTIVVYKQLQFIKNRPMGYDSKSLVEMPLEGMLFQKYDLLKERLLQSGAVNAMTRTTASISTQNSITRGLEWEGMSPTDRNINFNQIITSGDFTATTHVRMLMGRDFDKNKASDSSAILLNSSAVKAMNLKNPVGKQIVFNTKRTVIGVFEDIIWGDPTKKEMPMVIAWGRFPDVISMRLNEHKSTTEAIATISKITKELNPVYPVEIKFVDSLYQVKFERERTLSILSNLFGGLSIFVSCLGLLGLSAYSAELRTKEIGIRKVLGATNLSIVSLLSWNFLKMVLIAVAIGLPLSYNLMNSWLSRFDFRVEISVFMLLMSSLSILAIAYLTVSYQAIKAAKADPIKAIKYE